MKTRVALRSVMSALPPIADMQFRKFTDRATILVYCDCRVGRAVVDP